MLAMAILVVYWWGDNLSTEWWDADNRTMQSERFSVEGSITQNGENSIWSFQHVQLKTLIINNQLF